MAKHDTSESEEASSSNSSEPDEAITVGKGNGVSEYEKQRLSRIAENRARLEALGLPQMASSLKGSSQKPKKKGKEKVLDEDDDEEYVPEDEDGEPGSGSSSEQDDRNKDEDFAVGNASGTRKKKGKNKGLKMKGRVFGKKHVTDSEYIVDNDDDEALRQAIAISLQDSAEGSYLPDKKVAKVSKTEKRGNNVQENKERQKNKKSFASRLQMTEDELILHFFQIDEEGKGTITARDLHRVATAHDFLWTDEDLVDMIRCFDSDGDGKLTFDDFRKIVVRCNLIKES